MKTTEIKNAGGASVKYDIVNIGCKDCPYCMMAEGHYLCRSDKNCNAKANMTDDDDEPMQKVIIYSRVSTEKQTLEQQERTINEWLNCHNLKATHEVKDEGVSGKVSYKDRNLGKVVLPMLDKGDILIVSEVSRIGRSMSDINKFVNDELKPRGVRLVIVQMGIDLDCSHLKAIDEMLLFAFSFSAQMERELIQERTQSALEVRKQKLAQDGEFISKSGKVVKKLGRPRKCDLSNAQKAASAKLGVVNSVKSLVHFLTTFHIALLQGFSAASFLRFSDAAMMLQQMGVYSSTGKVLTKELVRSAYYNLRSVYGSQVYFRRGSANYRVMREKGMTDEEIQQYYKELNNNNNNTEEV